MEVSGSCSTPQPLHAPSPRQCSFLVLLEGPPPRGGRGPQRAHPGSTPPSLPPLPRPEREERATCEALKRQLVRCHGLMTAAGVEHLLGRQESDGGGGGSGPSATAGAETRFWQTLGCLEDALAGQQDQAGERYALTQLLAAWEPELHAVFLHYSLYDPGFATAWPPVLRQAGWRALLQDTAALPPPSAKAAVATAPELNPGVALREAAHQLFSVVASAAAAAPGPGPAPTTRLREEGSPTAQAPAGPPAAQAAGGLGFQLFCVALVRLAALLHTGTTSGVPTLTLSVRGARGVPVATGPLPCSSLTNAVWGGRRWGRRV